MRPVDARQNVGDAIRVQQQPYNPYAPPVPGGFAPAPMMQAPCWRDHLGACVYKHAAVLPPRCVKCNGPASHRIQKTLYWHEPWIYLTILGGVLVYAVIALLVRKQAHVEWSLCDAHKSQRTLGLATAGGGFLAGLALMFLGAYNTSSALLLAGVAGMLLLPIVGLVIARNITPKRIDDHYVWLNVGGPFLESLPPAG